MSPSAVERIPQRRAYHERSEQCQDRQLSCPRLLHRVRSSAFSGLRRAFELRRPDGTWHGQYIHVGGRNFIELFAGNLSDKAEGQSYGHICLEVEDIERTVSVLTERGVECTPIKLGGDGAYQSWLADPDGNRIELHQYTPEAKQGGFLE